MQSAIDSGGRPHAQVPAPVRFLLGALLAVALVGTALGVPRRNFPIGIALSPREVTWPWSATRSEPGTGLQPQMFTFPIPNRTASSILVLGTDGRCTLWDVTSQTAVATAAIEGMSRPLAVDAWLTETRRCPASR
jgi:hypothetical protein